ncbi:unnamed protein product [Dicrocoelium dendriticum]|nr:unnamed protein product [Dicrocoelium dendriticum]
MEALDAGLHVEEPVGVDLVSCVEEVPAEEPQQCDRENQCIAEVDEQSLNQIKLQCEFYFSDANILKDQFMLNQVKSSKDGWVNLGIIEKFKKVQKLTKSHDVIIRALANSEKLEVSEDGLMIRRRCPLPEWDPSVYYRSLIVSDLPDGTKLDHSDLTEIFTVRYSK